MILQQRNERDFLKPNLSQNPMETRARICERECEWVCEHERAQHPSRPLFKEKMAHAQGGPPGAPLRPGASSTVKFFENMVHGQNFASKDVQIIFSQRILKLKKYFWSFCKKGRILEKIPACRKQFWKFQTCSGEKQIRCKENIEKRRNQIWDKYQFTFGKGASFKVRRAPLFSIVLTICRLVLEN